MNDTPIDAHFECWVSITLPNMLSLIDTRYLARLSNALERHDASNFWQASAKLVDIDMKNGGTERGVSFSIIWKDDLASLTSANVMPGETVWINLLRQGVTMESPFAPFDDEGYEWANTVEPGVSAEAIDTIRKYGHEMNREDIDDLQEKLEQTRGHVANLHSYVMSSGNAQGDGLQSLDDRVEKLEHLHTQVEANLEMHRLAINESGPDLTGTLAQQLRAVADAVEAAGGE